MLEYLSIKKAKEGDKNEFIKLIDNNLDSMYRVAKGILNRREDIEDSIQNTIVAAYENIGQLKEIKYFKTWLIRILINECNKIFSNNKKYDFQEVVIDSITEDDYGDIDLMKCIKTLPQDLRVTTIMYYFEDMSIKEIAAALIIAEGTVKSRLSRAREKLYEIMKEGE